MSENLKKPCIENLRKIEEDSHEENMKEYEENLIWIKDLREVGSEESLEEIRELEERNEDIRELERFPHW